MSRVVNNEPGVRPETEEAVRAAIALLGFHRNDLARTLRGGPTGTIGVIIQDVANPSTRWWRAVWRTSPARPDG